MTLSEQSLLAQGQTLFPAVMRCRVDLRVQGPSLCALPRAPGRSPACSGGPRRLGCNRPTVQQDPCARPCFHIASCVWLMGGLPGTLHADVHLGHRLGEPELRPRASGKGLRMCPRLISGVLREPEAASWSTCGPGSMHGGRAIISECLPRGKKRK